MVRYLVSVAMLSTLAASVVVMAGGCEVGTSVDTFTCAPDATDWYCPDSGLGGGNGFAPLSCKANGGECVEMGSTDFREKAMLLWIGPEEDQPECPERADSEAYRGYGDLTVAFECAKCSCGPANCIMPNSMDVDPDHFCQGANAASYAAPTDWDGSCVSPSILPAGSFSSIKLNPATVSPCEPKGDPIPKPPGFAPGPKSFANGVYWGKFAKACQGTAAGKCENSGDLCLPSAAPPPPEFRQCVQYILPVDESKLPKCPEAFPEQFVFYADVEGKAECSACECGAPVGNKCNVAFSAYQDPACAAQPMPIFENIAVGAGFCADFAGVPGSLGSMQAKWGTNEPGTCEPSGGELIGQVKAVDPRLFCCQAHP